MKAADLIGPYEIIEPIAAAGVSAVDFVWLTPDGKSYVYSFKRLLSQLYVVDGFL